MPVGTGTLFVQHDKNPQLLIRESKCKNVTETQESQVIQYIANGGFRKYSKYVDDVQYISPSKIISAIHAGPGQICFGFSHQQKADLTLTFKSVSNKPAILFIHNYHGKGPYGHYEGHCSTCRLHDKKTNDFKVKIESEKMDLFRHKLAEAWSLINPNHLIVEYSTSHACEFYCGNYLDSLTIPDKKYLSLYELLHLDFPQPNDDIYLPQCVSNTRKILNKSQLKNDILNNKQTGFVTIKGGNEKTSNNICDIFGFCVQKVKPTRNMLSPFTIEQIKQYFHFTSNKEIDHFLENLPERTLNACTFINEETMSTTYLKWLMKERGFDNFTITHFIAYKFSNYTREFLGSILQQRHEFKLLGLNTEAQVAKLIMNSHYG